MPSPETIIALSTPPGSSALAVLRLSGPHAHDIVRNLTPSLPPPQSVRYAPLQDDQGWIDDVVLTAWKNPHSFTGEDTIEISCHGNMLIVDRILRACLQAGARQAEPGEFTRRAFLNGKMDLTRAEAVLDIISARSERALQAARRLQAGALAQRLESLRAQLLDSLAHIEADIDFPDEDIQPESHRQIQDRLQSTSSALDLLLETAREGRLLREGVTVVLVGPPNVGKSSLMNALLGEERAIVSERAGTTRDRIEACLILDGILVRLVDTAGLHDTEDEIEIKGISLTRRAIEEADLVLLLSEPEATSPPDLDLPDSTPLLHCRTKCDLHPGAPPPDGITTSALDGTGIRELKHTIADTLKLGTSLSSQEQVAINDRHRHHLEKASTLLHTLLNEWDARRPPELVSSDLRLAIREMESLLGVTDEEAVLDRIFSQFCIGK